jgi:hypothetical protein
MNQTDRIKNKRLHTLAQTLQLKKPWDFFEEIGIFAVTLANRKTPYYCVFLQETIVVCPNQAALKGLFYLSEQNEMPQIQRLRYQQHFACYYEMVHDIAEQQHELFKELKIDPIDNRFPMFESTMPGLLPDELVKQEIQTMSDILKQIDESLSQLESIKQLKHDINLHMVHRYFDFDLGEWTFGVLEMIDESLDVKPVQISDDVISQVNALSSNKETWEVDVAYTPVMVEAKKDHRQGVIRVLLIANQKQQQIYRQQLITLKDDSNQLLVDTLITTILEKGLPQHVLVRDEIVLGLLQHLMDQTAIDVKVSQQLDVIDLYVIEFSKQHVN